MTYGVVYLVTNKHTGEQYVGQTRQKFLRRWAAHINTAKSKVAKKYKLANAILMFGEDAFLVEDLFYAFDAVGLDSAEIQIIDALKPTYNIAKGGAGHRGVRPSVEGCKARSERLRQQWANPEWRKAQVERIKAVAKTPEATLRGRTVSALGSAARAKQVVCVELNTAFDSIAEAARQLGMSHTGVRHAIAHKIQARGQFTLQEVVS